MEQKLTVLVAEDEEINRRILQKILSTHYEVLQAENGRKAWEILTNQACTVDALLTDLVMPEMDGYRLLEKIRQAGMTELPVVVMTGENDTQTEEKALSAGAWDFVTKPYHAQILLSRLRNAVARRQVSVYQRMRRMAAHDSLTGLHNRGRMFERTRRMLNENPEQKFAFYRIDVDQFALYNAAFGEEEGDRLLCFLADQIRGMSERFSLCCTGRVSGDVFCACVPYSGSDAVLRSAVEEMRKKLKKFREDYRIEISVGVYLIEDNSVSVEECYMRATMGAQQCKRRYGMNIGYFDASVEKKAQQEIAIANEMETALRERQFVVYFQPKVSVADGRPAGAEALVRWKHPQKGLISPGLFIPVFESNGFIARLDYYVWEETCRMLRSWLDSGKTPMPVSVNVSRISLYNPNLVQIMTDLVKKYHLDGDYLQLEVTESTYMTEPELMKETLSALRKAGFTLLMDDFGSGYSSLNMLKEIEVDVLKIDMKFLPEAGDSEKAEIILASVIKMANWLGMKVVVEGVETKEQRDFLEGAGCDYIQGYFYARPMPQAEYEKDYVFGRGITTEAQKKPASNDTEILIVDDSAIDRAILTEFLQERYRVHTCESAEDGLLYLKRSNGRVKLILLDNLMSGMSGMDFLTYCQDLPVLRVIPKIMITAGDAVETQALAFQRGAYDFITKPLVKEVISARVNHALEISHLYRTFDSSEYQRRSIAQRDSFTGVLNKNAFYEMAARHLDYYPNDVPALLVLDLDDFKGVNDQYGHQTGDSILKTMADVLNREFRKTDLVGRFGGDEFVVMMSNLTHQELARRKAAEIIKSISISCAREQHLDASVSIGVAFRKKNDTVESLFERADRALYEAKNSGKGRVVVYGEQVPPLRDDDKPIVLICGEDPQLYPALALSYGNSAAFANITGMQGLRENFEKYGSRIRVVCLDMQKRVLADSDAFYQYIVQHGGGTTVPIVAVCKEGDMEHLRAALSLNIQDTLTLPPQMDVIQRKLSRLIMTGCI